MLQPLFFLNPTIFYTKMGILYAYTMFYWECASTLCNGILKHYPCNIMDLCASKYSFSLLWSSSFFMGHINQLDNLSQDLLPALGITLPNRLKRNLILVIFKAIVKSSFQYFFHQNCLLTFIRVGWSLQCQLPKLQSLMIIINNSDTERHFLCFAYFLDKRTSGWTCVLLWNN